MRYRTNPALIRAALIDAERTTVYAAARRIGVRESRIYFWRKCQREAGGGVWPTDEDIADWASKREAREKDHKYRVDRLTIGRRTIDPTGTQRRLRALRAIGWTWDQLAVELGVSRSVAFQWGVDKPRGVYRETAQTVADAYARLSMQPQTGWVADRARVRAARLGYAPPLAWDNIDDPREKPQTGGKGQVFDDVIVDRLLAGERLKSNRAEKEEAMRRWLAAGRSQRSLCAMHGWAENRYVADADERVA